MWEPGIVRVGVGPFQPYAVLNGRADSIIAGSGDNPAHYLMRVLPKPLPENDILETQAVSRECLALGDLARMIVADGHGGIVLVVQGETGAWSKSLDPFPYRFVHPDRTIPDAIRLQLTDTHAQGEILEQLGTAPPCLTTLRAVLVRRLGRVRGKSGDTFWQSFR
jgi:hypothetical protein